MMEKIKEFFDLKTSAVFAGATAQFATIPIDRFLSVSIGFVTLTIGILKLVEMFTGKKISVMVRKKHHK